MAARRVAKELTEITNSEHDWSVSLIDKTDLFHWKVLMKGPENTPYQGGIFTLNATFSSDYPFKPPNVRFTTRIYHLNVYDKGKIELFVLDDNWSPIITMSFIFSAIQSLLIEPNIYHSVDKIMLSNYTDNKPLYEHIARIWTRRYASNIPISL